MTRTHYTMLFAVVGAVVTWWFKRPAADAPIITTKGTDTLATTSADRQGDAQRITM